MSGIVCRRREYSPFTYAPSAQFVCNFLPPVRHPTVLRYRRILTDHVADDASLHCLAQHGRNSSRVDPLEEDPGTLNVIRGSATIATIGFLVVMLLAFESQHKLSVSRLVNALHALGMVTLRGTKDLVRTTKHMSIPGLSGEIAEKRQGWACCDGHGAVS
jgi:hypothetical protein